MPEKAFAFVLMPFDREFDDVYSLGIKATVEQAGMLAERVDEQVFHPPNPLRHLEIFHVFNFSAHNLSIIKQFVNAHSFS